MKCCVSFAAILMIILCCIPVFTSARHVRTHLHVHQPNRREGLPVKPNSYWDRSRGPMMKRKGPDTLQIAGSSLPDCSHACGSCTPCRLVMVSFVCASLEEAETCPMTYKCVCNNKSYPVP
ncbi:hypothetical protein COLO4_21238 [Corchorus olitorius]|uniref:Epidermal patterning factor-like protein n=1 Tax=Corchorus olitorius TaxID=93759 RepID=A0A1R3IUS5_9ROSI|nr:hypothetical protein COLO4_21238 [Corchorus olitorius]